MAANLTQIVNFKANFHQECKLFSKIKIYANNMVDTLRFSVSGAPNGGVATSPPEFWMGGVEHLSTPPDFEKIFIRGGWLPLN